MKQLDMVFHVARAIHRRYGNFPQSMVSEKREMPAFEIVTPVRRPAASLIEPCDTPLQATPAHETHVIRWYSHRLELPRDHGVFRMAEDGPWLRWICANADELSSDSRPIVLLEQP